MARTAQTAAAAQPPRRRTQAEGTALSEKLMLRAAIKETIRRSLAR